MLNPNIIDNGPIDGQKDYTLQYGVDYDENFESYDDYTGLENSHFVNKSATDDHDPEALYTQVSETDISFPATQYSFFSPEFPFCDEIYYHSHLVEEYPIFSLTISYTPISFLNFDVD